MLVQIKLILLNFPPDNDKNLRAVIILISIKKQSGQTELSARLHPHAYGLTTLTNADALLSAIA